MASQIANEIRDVVAGELKVGLFVTENSACAKAIDSALAPVRSCLEGLITHHLDFGRSDEPHWCAPKSYVCTEACQRAREVWGLLEIK